MANLSVTSLCNRDCSYCFARAALEPAGHMTIEQFEGALDFLERSGVDQARLLGGEPTLHPDFPGLADRVLERGLRLLVFSNGLMPEAALRRLEETPTDRTGVLINIDAAQIGAVAGTLRRLGVRATLGLNISQPGFEPGFLLDLIREFGLSRCIRFGLAHPCVAAANRFLHPRYYRAVGQRLVDFARQAEAAGVELDFDCGFVPCMFPPGGLEALGKAGADVGMRCYPIPDVLPDGSVVSCYPLAALDREPLPREHDAAWLRGRFAARLASSRTLGIFPECADCKLRESSQCAGGCLAAALRRRRQAQFTVSLPEPAARNPRSAIHDPWFVPYVDQPLAFWERLKAEFGRFICQVYFPLPGDFIGSGRPPQPAEHLPGLLRSALFAHCVLINPITLPPVELVAPRVIEMLRQMMGEYGLASATVSSLLLAARIRDALPELKLAASVLMDIARPNQALMLEGICQTLVPASRVVRDRAALAALRAAFPGRIRLIVNEACLPGCPYRVQHFQEMASGLSHPQSLCQELLEQQPWMRLTGAWVLPQHLHLYDGLYDELKLAGRVTLGEEAAYRRVLEAYICRRPLAPHAIGGGPASVLEPMEITEEFFARTLECGQRCHECSRCREYYEHEIRNRRSTRSGLRPRAGG